MAESFSPVLSTPAPPSRTLKLVRCPCCDTTLRESPSEAAPRCLPCGHSVCGVCATRALACESPACPICTLHIKDDCPVNIGLAEYAESMYLQETERLSVLVTPDQPSPADVPWCVDCERDEDKVAATFICVDYNNRPVCDAHASVHQQKKRRVDVLPAARSHKSARSLRCSKHPGCEINHFCISDSTPVCPECVLYVHTPASGHEVRRMEAAAGLYGSRLAEALSMCRVGVGSLSYSVDVVTDAKQTLVTQTRASCDRYSATIDELITTLRQRCAAVVSMANDACTKRCGVLDAHAAELRVSVEQLRTAVDMCEAAQGSGDPLKLARALEAAVHVVVLVKTFGGLRVDTTIDITTDLSGLSERFERMTVLRLSAIDASQCSAAGAGLRSFVNSDSDVARKHNVFRLTCKDGTGACIRGLSPTDVAVQLYTSTLEPVPTTVAMSVADDGSLLVVYTTNSPSVSNALLHVLVSDHDIAGSPWTLHAVDPSTVPAAVPSGEIEIVAGKKFGLAVSDDERYLAVASIGATHCIVVYDLPTCALTRVLGSWGSSVGQFKNPHKICFVPGKHNLLVSDFSNNRVQEVSVDGTFLRAIACPAAWSVSCNGTYIAVGKSLNGSGFGVELFHYASGTPAGQFGPFGSAAGHVTTCESVRFTPDGLHLLVSELNSPRISMFTTLGLFVKHIGIGIVANNSANDAVMDVDGRVHVADCSHHRLITFSPTGELQPEHVLAAGYNGEESVPSLPTAVAIVNSRLYVLDSALPLVYVLPL